MGVTKQETKASFLYLPIANACFGIFRLKTPLNISGFPVKGYTNCFGSHQLVVHIYRCPSFFGIVAAGKKREQ